ncbi:trans-sulfuration enzyme family protein [Pelagicoccus albus]|uniref:Aminotransferase class I/II-fold pyridoxal phosphate-dependent enzyme n=1 Tax=Pelagicoccus albus TaxID=415222 RepID=A0A7X1B3T9_9BACT|nr:aminotransferase class I/II-fold pyridoxal phosphate-dependent enzyme [Pelagicoccus albus]MBC2605129.1 aminotransferase class I/II-fold pyridoxal phosphate-dependent enzyme [Pelagicoccus albus]
MNYDTDLMHFAEDPAGQKGAVVPPISQNSLFTFESWDAIDEAFQKPADSYIYSRGINPTVEIAERKIAQLAGGERARLFASGMGAISSAILHYVKQGDHIVTVKNVYGPTSNFLGKYLPEKCGITTTFVEGNSIEDFEQAITEKTKLIYLESPSSVVFSLQDIQAVTSLAKSKGIHTVIDNTWATPIFQRPLELGIDLEVHSVSKYLGGHSDIVSGVIIGKAEDIRSIILTEHALLGAKMAPYEAWLLIRSLRTLTLRMEKHQSNAMAVAEWLEAHPQVGLVMHPALPSSSQHELYKKQMTGGSGLFAFNLKETELPKIKAFVNACSLFQIGVSWGGHESLIYAPAISLAKEIPPERFCDLGIELGTIRLSVGLENPQDLIADLSQAFAAMNS